MALKFNTITARTNGLYMQDEAIANAVIRPGMLLEERSDGKVEPHGVAGGNVMPKFAVEDDLQGKGIDDLYASGARVIYRTFQRGDRVWALLDHDQTVVVGDYVESAGNGLLRKHTPTTHEDSGSTSWEITMYTNPIVGKVKQAVATEDSSSDSTWDAYYGTRVLIEVV